MKSKIPKMLRLVLQVQDTTANRLAFHDAWVAIKRVPLPFEGHVVLKREEIDIWSIERPGPRPEQAAEGQKSEDEKPKPQEQ